MKVHYLIRMTLAVTWTAKIIASMLTMLASMEIWEFVFEKLFGLIWKFILIILLLTTTIILLVVGLIIVAILEHGTAPIQEFLRIAEEFWTPYFMR